MEGSFLKDAKSAKLKRILGFSQTFFGTIPDFYTTATGVAIIYTLYSFISEDNFNKGIRSNTAKSPILYS